MGLANLVGTQNRAGNDAWPTIPRNSGDHWPGERRGLLSHIPRAVGRGDANVTDFLMTRQNKYAAIRADFRKLSCIWRAVDTRNWLGSGNENRTAKIFGTGLYRF